MSLAIKRKAGQGVKIGEAIVTVIEVRGGWVRISIEAPPHVHIVRTELLSDEGPLCP